MKDSFFSDMDAIESSRAPYLNGNNSAVVEVEELRFSQHEDGHNIVGATLKVVSVDQTDQGLVPGVKRLVYRDDKPKGKVKKKDAETNLKRHLKSLLEAAYGTVEQSPAVVIDGKKTNAAMSEAQPLTGVKIRVESNEIITQGGKKFTNYTFSPLLG